MLTMRLLFISRIGCKTKKECKKQKKAAKKSKKNKKKNKKAHKKHYKSIGGTDWATEKAEWEAKN